MKNRYIGLNTIFGINGVGKDTVAEALRQRNPEIKVVSGSRLLMYLLGIAESYDVRERVSEYQYKILEQTSQSIKVHVMENEYRQQLEKMSKDGENVILLAHLVTAFRHGSKIQYLKERPLPTWHAEINTNLIQLVAPAILISERRKTDATRHRQTSVAQIIKHQALCDKEWGRIELLGPCIKDKMHTVKNIDLETAVKEVESIVYGC